MTYAVTKSRALILCIPTALLFYVGAVLVANDRYDYAQMAKVFALVIFSVTFASQAMIYSESPFDGTACRGYLRRSYAPSSRCRESDASGNRSSKVDDIVHGHSRVSWKRLSLNPWQHRL